MFGHKYVLDFMLKKFHGKKFTG